MGFNEIMMAIFDVVVILRGLLEIAALPGSVKEFAAGLDDTVADRFYCAVLAVVIMVCIVWCCALAAFDLIGLLGGGQC